MDSVLPKVIAKLRRNPYGILHVINLHMATNTILQYLAQSIEKGELEAQGVKATLAHAIIIMTGAFVLQGNIGFSKDQTKYTRI